MKENFSKALFPLFFLCLAAPAKAQHMPTFDCYLTNDTLISPTVFEFDVYLLRTGTDTFELAGAQWAFQINSAVVNGGTLTPSVVPGTSQLSNTGQVPITVNLPTVSYCFNVAATIPPGPGLGSIISNANGGCSSPGTRVATFKITNSVPFAQAPMNLYFNFLASAGRSVTDIFAYIVSVNTRITGNGTYYSYNSLHSCLSNNVLNSCHAAPATISLGGTDTLICTPSYSSYQWYFNGYPIAGATDSSYVFTQGGHYNVLVVDTGGCMAVSNSIFIPGCNLALSTNVINASCATCTDGEAGAGVTGGTPPITYTWYTSPIQNTSSALNLTPGTYTVCVSDGNGCTACGSVYIDSTRCGTLAVSMNSYNASCGTCNDGSATATVSGGAPPYSYSWCSGATTSSATNLLPGTCTLCITDQAGCHVCDSTSIGVGHCSASFNLYPDTIPHNYIAVNTATGAPPISYLWSWGDGGTDTAAYPNHTYASSGTYTICLDITDSVGCSNHYCSTYFLLRRENTMVSVNVIAPLITGLVNTNSIQDLMIFPNPSHGSVTLNFSLAKSTNVSVKIYNSLSEKVQQQNLLPLTAGPHQITLDVQSLSSGIYFFEMTDKHGNVFHGKFLIE